MNGAKFARVSVGRLAAFGGKEFPKESVCATSCGTPFGTLAKGQAFFHSHGTERRTAYGLTRGEPDERGSVGKPSLLLYFPSMRP